MAIDPQLTFRYQFSVRASGVEQGAWAGEGAGRADFGQAEGLVGPKPRFELSSGWLTLSPTEGWTRSFRLERSPMLSVAPRKWMRTPVSRRSKRTESSSRRRRRKH